MPKQPRLALAVQDLRKSVLFYVEKLGFTFDETPGEDIVQIIDSDGDPFLLTGPQAINVLSYLSDDYFTRKPGEVLKFASIDVNALSNTLAARGIKDLHLSQTRMGDHKLEFADPDGYIIRFIEPAHLSPQQTFALYLQCIDELEAVLAGLNEADLVLSRNIHSWSIRQIVHHLTDSETLFVWWLKFCLTDSGRIYNQNWPSSNENRDHVLESAQREIGPSLALFKATRMHIAQLVQHISDPWERYTEDNAERRTTFTDLVNLLTRHAMEHIDEITEIRRMHGR